MKTYLMSIGGMLILLMTVGCQTTAKSSGASTQRELAALRHQVVVEQFKSEEAEEKLRIATLEKERMKHHQLMMTKLAASGNKDQETELIVDSSQQVVANHSDEEMKPTQEQIELQASPANTTETLLVSLESHWEELPALSPEESETRFITHESLMANLDAPVDEEAKLQKQLEDLRKAKASMMKAEAMFRDLDALRQQGGETRYAQK